MPRPAIYLDECVSMLLVVRLHWRGFRVSTAGDAGLLQASDEEQLAYAAQQSLLLIIHNIRHFTALHHQYLLNGWFHHGLLTLPYSPIALLDIRVALSLDWIATFPDYQSRLFRWHDLQQRLIQGERIAGYNEEEVRRALGQPM